MIRTEGLTKRYGDFTALDDLNLEIEQGDIYGFIGPNGAGKTTTIRILATLLAPTAGVAYVDGVDVMKEPFAVKRILGYMPDEFGVYDGMRLREYLDFFGAAYRIPNAKRSRIIDDVLQLTDLTARADEYVNSFSRGMKQRCCLAKTLIHDPKVLLLDEPASGLDPRARIEMKELLKTLCGMGKTILISSHILSELGDMSNKIGILERGKLLASGNVRSIMERVRQVLELRLEVLEGADATERILAQTPGIVDVERSGNEFQMQSKLGRDDIAALHTKLVQSGVKVLFLAEEQSSLEDVFLSVTKGGI
ncbi:MAG: ABC transporter ATP-binding protein [Candidatus Hydrogenedentota bacterium]